MVEHDESAAIVRLERSEPHNGRAIQILCHTDRLFAAVQYVSEGGEDNLHSHRYLDGFWFVLGGRARFYTTDDELLGDLGPNEGVLIPRGFPYWFASAGDEELVLLQVEASSKVATDGLKGFGEGRTDYTPTRPEMAEVAVRTAQAWAQRQAD